MTEIEYKAVKALASCRFLPGTFDKRIARKWAEKAAKDLLAPMTDKGRACLWRLVWKYRRQIEGIEMSITVVDDDIVQARPRCRDYAVYRMGRSKPGCVDFCGTVCAEDLSSAEAIARLMYPVSGGDYLEVEVDK